MEADPSELAEGFLPGGLRLEPLLTASERRDVAMLLLLRNPLSQPLL